jgi:hypothetical protein
VTTVWLNFPTGLPMKRSIVIAGLATVAICLNVAHAQVGDPTLRTDHPQYPGVGAFQTIEDCVAFATQGVEGEQQQAIALYNWLLTHQWHLASPQEWCIPGRTPDTAQTRDYENVVYDANSGRFSYGYGLCGTVHAWNEPYWEALGMKARRRAFPGHTNSEIFYGGSWHAFDTDMAGLLFRKDGVVAGYEDIIADPSLVDSVKPPHPHYPFAWPGDFNAMKQGWQQVAAGGNWYSMYNGGYAAQPGIIHLRKGETFTRYYDPDHYGGPSKRRFWHNMKNGPRRPWSFYGQDEPSHDGETHNARNDVSYCNGEFVWRPDVSAHMTRIGDEIAYTFEHWSPYVIAGDPDDDANPMSGIATGGLVMTGTNNGLMRVEVERDHGQWRERPSTGLKGNGPFVLDLTNEVKGRNVWRVRVHLLLPNMQLRDLEFTTVTQVNPSIYPRLTPEGCEVAYRAASRAVLPVIPDFSLPEADINRYEEVQLRSPNISYTPRSEDNRLVYRTIDNKPGKLVFRLDASERLTEVRAAIRYQLRVPPPENCDYHLDISTDDGKTWRTFATADIPADNEHSSGWLAGTADVSADDVTEALVRVHLYAGGHQTGLIDARLYGVYRTPEPGPLEITWGWQEDGQPRRHTETIAAGTTEATFEIPTGRNVRDEFVRMSAR